MCVFSPIDLDNDPAELAQLLNDYNARAGISYFSSPEDVATELNSFGRPLAQCATVRRHGDRVVGAGQFSDYVTSDGYRHFRLSVTVADGYDSERAILLQWLMDSIARVRASEPFDGPEQLVVDVPEADVSGRQFWIDSGFEAIRWFTDMVHSLDDVTVQTVEDGYTVRQMMGDEHIAHGRLVRNDSFADHWGSGQTSESRWAVITGAQSMRPELSLVAYSPDGQPAALIMCMEFEAMTKRNGYRQLFIALVGTRREHRGKGLASALLSTALAQAKKAGYGNAKLSVDSANPSGAHHLYEALGFQAADTNVCLAKSL